jgi:hypothetical protein
MHLVYHLVDASSLLPYRSMLLKDMIFSPTEKFIVSKVELNRSIGERHVLMIDRINLQSNAFRFYSQTELLSGREIDLRKLMEIQLIELEKK